MSYEKERNKAAKENLGLWREEAKRNSEKNLERDFSVEDHQFSKLKYGESLFIIMAVCSYG